MTALQLANRALRILGEPVLSGFDDAGSVAALVNDLFPQTFRLMLKEEDWHWARLRAELSQDESFTHYTEWEYVYDAPSDLLQIRSIIDQDAEEIVFEYERGHIFTNTAPYTTSDSATYPRILYTADVLTDTVGDGSGYPELVAGYATAMEEEFEIALAARLAMEMAGTITKDEQTLRATTQTYYLALQRAKQINAIATPGYGARDYDDWSSPVG